MSEVIKVGKMKMILGKVKIRTPFSRTGAVGPDGAAFGSEAISAGSWVVIDGPRVPDGREDAPRSGW